MNRRTRFREVLRWGLAAAALLALALPGAAQQLTGNIFGHVEDEQGGRLPGVTVTLSGPTPAAPQTSDGRGEFRFVNLSPGTYTLTFDLQGFSRVTKPDVQVGIGQNTAAATTLRLSTVEAAITVQGESALLDTRKVETGAVVDQVELKSIPTARDPWVILQSIPGVQTDRVNVGGNESGQQSVYTGKGVEGAQNVWNLDGVTITDTAALGSSGTYYDFDSFEEIQASTGGSDVTAMTPGVQLNLVTKRGTNDVHGSARVLLTQEEAQSTPNLSAQDVADGASGGNRISEVQDYGAEVGGPILRDRIWLWGAYGRNQIDLLTPAGQSDKTTLEDINAKLNIQPFESTALTGTYTAGEKIKLGRNVGLTRPPETAWNQGGIDGDPSTLYKGEISHVFSPKLFATATYSYFGGGFQLVPAGGENVNNVFRDAGLVWHNSYYTYKTNRPQHQAGANGSYFFNTGTMGHELKFGFSYRSTPVGSETSWPGDGNWGDARPLASGQLRANLTRAGITGYDLEYYNGYLGDTLTVGNLTINAGARYDLQRGNNKGSFSPANPVIPDLLPALEGEDSPVEFEWEDISPRLGVTYAVGSQKKLIVKASYARFADQLGIAVLGFNNPNQIAGLNFAWNDNGDRIITRDELDFNTGNECGSVLCRSFYGFDPANPTLARSPNVVDPDLEAARTDEIVLGLDWEVLPDFVVGANYSYRTRDGVLPYEQYPLPGYLTGLTSNDFVLGGTVTGVLFNGDSYSEPVYILRDGVEVPSGYTLRNRPDYEVTYHGVDLNFQKRLSNKWMLRGSIGWQDWTQSAGDDSCVDPTNFRVAVAGFSCPGEDIMVERSTGSGNKAEVFINSTWQFNVAALYQLPLGFNVAGNVYGREGYPRIQYHREGLDDGLGDRLVLIGQMDDIRYDDVYNVDLRLEKIIDIQRLQVSLTADVFNVLNDATVLQRVGEVTATNYNRIVETQSPRVLRLGARVSF